MPPNDGQEACLERTAIRERMKVIGHKILVLSGKGGVGKSTVAANLAVSLIIAGKRVGLLDVDIHGPSIPRLLNLEGNLIRTENGALLPVRVGDNLHVMSIGFMLAGSEDPVIWRGPMKMGVIKRFLKDVHWGCLDYLIIDSPPGTGDEPLSVCQLVENADGAVIVTTPQEIALADVRRCVNFCRALELPVLGVVENMSGFVCPKCGTTTEIFKTGGGERMAEEMGIPFLGRIPIDPSIVEACDSGRPYIQHYARTETARIFEAVIRPIIDRQAILSASRRTADGNTLGKEEILRIAIPVAGGRLAMHFGHCDRFALVDVDTKEKKIVNREMVDAPEHQPGLLPGWLAGRGANVIIAGGMGMRAQQLFAQHGIEVLVGASPEDPEAIVSSYLDGSLQTGPNVCDH